ncbi:hypothetical protein ACJRO7_027128 [Eucalyptus globulus]|uniref:Late embryogenesis abundant protein LEA-2 subgroup domain-containing protein n=1 Tax=Eucalyptus globulus TaxID=34317 RepID=A0ABD3JXC7_EUCGL
MEAQWQQQQQHQHRDRSAESNREFEAKQIVAYCLCGLALCALAVVVVLLLSLFEGDPPVVHVASLSLSLSSVPAPPSPSPSVVSGNWSVALSVKNNGRWCRLGWDHAQVMLFYGREFVAGTLLEKFSVAPKGEGTLEMTDGRVAAFSRDVGEWAAQAMAKDREDGGVMELTVSLLYHDDGSRYWLGWDRFVCHGLKVGFSSQNQSQVGSLLSNSTHKCT